MGRGVKAAIVGIPLRNMHTPVEIINMNDLSLSTKLLVNFLLDQKIESILRS